ncbi:DUF4234 domain-containing protein [Ureaplasma parvum]|uniref:Putative phosphotransferase enzyme IIB component UU178 n=3 Tax=Ureaplasma parvum TaxID=134821 RepID=Y178_UREPA|nr:hypothetical protein [Ureaplasma parvum]Q9PQW5.1 RecName: Full=Putative phosphotransferase enzyme IIB component UU178; AltName: Full=Putative PTS system EIIB component [Ureaplasma parvum serovar 3 str. ATCC 700970]pir/E82924/ conserved hypothetical UU178 [imported] - Ureaplasma urealyticum [Ureaplasma urealyticum]AAF30585.1 conserved hypothetical [Ureaplasma parvum serovar 3 str. ATCC 700970]ACA33007.1 conserved hypothetical protein [Ureaplasma parvum serovar 3 str. ATCC 27815]ASD24498.1 DU
MQNLNNKQKTLIIFLGIITFGIFIIYFFTKAKKVSQIRNTHLIVSSNIPFSLNDFYNCIGSKNNLVNVDATINTLKIELKEINALNNEKLKVLGAKGIMCNQTKISIIFGDFCLELKELIKKDLFS